ncbi:MAG: hypothetical protein AMS20_00565 [Gemmatimonas sp. SG8_28]|jgi:hypothetical protein|nr:MAG: hypothetical protein AMS20_00565 [Gemmatimonas sp. SG8_28]
MRHAHTGSRSARSNGAGRIEVPAERHGGTRDQPPTPHTLLDDRGRQIGQITRASTPPEFGRLEPTLLLRRDAASTPTNTGPQSVGQDSERDQ